LDLGRVNRIAATVLQNIQRDMIRDIRRETQRQRVTSNTIPEGLPDERAPGGSHLSISLLRADVARIIGDNASLVIRVAVEGFTQAEVAVEFGISDEAARKRYQRASVKLRRAHEKKCVSPCPVSAGGLAFPNQTPRCVPLKWKACRHEPFN
jgi:RNA polymerase sigma-70 factor (ECF subfamily)